MGNLGVCPRTTVFRLKESGMVTDSAAGQKIASYRDLIVWQKGMDLVDLVYDLVDTFPGRERFGLTSQITRSVVSVPANIAEGQGRPTPRDFANFLAIARSSLHETETLLTISVRRKFVNEAAAADAFSLSRELSKMLISLRLRILSSKRRA
jgi:four helix bundle protein